MIANTSHIRIIVLKVDNNRSTNKCTPTNKSTRSTITKSEHNKESTFNSI